MDPILKHEVALYLFPVFTNTSYFRNKEYYKALEKKYGKKK